MAGSYNGRLRQLETLKADSEFAFTFAIAHYDASGEPSSYLVNDTVVDRERHELSCLESDLTDTVRWD